jgi:hypothetical protein
MSFDEASNRRGEEKCTNLGRKYLKKIHNLEDVHSDKMIK